jgi:hypothetical protein
MSELTMALSTAALIAGTSSGASRRQPRRIAASTAAARRGVDRSLAFRARAS